MVITLASPIWLLFKRFYHKHASPITWSRSTPKVGYIRNIASLFIGQCDAGVFRVKAYGIGENEGLFLCRIDAISFGAEGSRVNLFIYARHDGALIESRRWWSAPRFDWVFLPHASHVCLFSGSVSLPSRHRSRSWLNGLVVALLPPRYL